jgi:hypothetical protein
LLGIGLFAFQFFFFYPCQGAAQLPKSVMSFSSKQKFDLFRFAFHGCRIAVIDRNDAFFVSVPHFGSPLLQKGQKIISQSRSVLAPSGKDADKSTSGTAAKTAGDYGIGCFFLHSFIGMVSGFIASELVYAFSDPATPPRRQQQII